MTIEVRLMLPEEAILANDFFNKIYGTGRSLEEFKWEFVDGPKGPAIYVVAVDIEQGKIVGIQCAIPLEMISGMGTQVLTAKSEDTLVDPHYRGQKIFERMYALLFSECHKRDIQYIWGFTPAFKAFERLGFTIPFKTEQCLFVTNPFKAYTYLSTLAPKNSITSSLKILGLCVLSTLKGSLSSVFKSKIDLRLVPTDLDEKAIDPNPLIQNKELWYLDYSAAYLLWRIAKNPNGNDYKNYHFIDSSASVRGVFLLNIRKNVSYIEQFAFSPECSTKQQVAMIRVILAELKKFNVSLIRTMNFTTNQVLTNEISSLEKSGFIYLKRGDNFVWKKIGDKESIQPENIFLSRLFTQGNR